MKIKQIPTVVEFLKLMSDVAANLQKACQAIVSMVDANPRVIDEIVKAEPRYSYNLLWNMDRVGRGKMYSELLLDNSPGARKLFALPPSQQKEIYEHPIHIVIGFRAGSPVVSSKPIQQLSQSEASLAFESTGRPRTVEEQAALLSKPRGTQPAQRYKIEGGKLIVLMAKTEFDAATLEKCLAELKANATKSLQSEITRNQLIQRR